MSEERKLDVCNGAATRPAARRHGGGARSHAHPLRRAAKGDKILMQNHARNAGPPGGCRLTIRQQRKPDRVVRGAARAGDGRPRETGALEVAGR
jgi:hypothetical protein